MVAGHLAAFKSYKARYRTNKIINLAEENAITDEAEKNNSIGAGLLRLPKPDRKK
jgi:hypothetical protein